MNKIYRVVWNAETGQWVVASEMAKGRKKKASGASNKLALTLVGVATIGGGMGVSGSAFAATGYVEVCNDQGGEGTTMTTAKDVWTNPQCGPGSGVFINGNGDSRNYGTTDAGAAQAFIDVSKTGVAIGATNGVTFRSRIEMANHQIRTMAAGTADTDAVNVSQLKGVTTALGGGAAVNSDGTIKAPTYTVQGTTANDVGTALSKLDGAVNKNTGDISTLNTTVNNITNGGGIKYFHANSTAADSSANGEKSVAIGGGAKATYSDTVAIGENAQATYLDNMAIGSDASGAGGASIAIGTRASTLSGDGVNFQTALGVEAKSGANQGTALGGRANAKVDNSVALGSDSVADRASGIGGSTKGAVSVGSGGAGVATDTRQIISVARGTQDTDAVNVSQLKGVTTALGGGTAVNADGTIKAPTYTVQGTTANDVGTALTKLDGAVNKNTGDISTLNTTVNNITNGGGIKYFHANSTLADSAATGANSIAVGPAATAKSNNGVAIGNAANANDGSTVSIGGASEAKGSWSVALGTNAKTALDTSVALGSNSSVTVAGGVALGDSTVADRASGIGGSTKAAVSVGSGGAGVATTTRQIISVARGTQDTDAVNLSQLKGVTTALGGGTAVNADGTIKAPTYTVGGQTYNDVGSAITAAAASNGNVDALNWNATTGAYDATHGGAARKITNVENGTVSATSKDAVNGSQLNTTNQNVTNVSNTVNNITNGGGIKYFHANGTLADSSATGAEAIAVGPNAKSAGKWSVAMGTNSDASADNSVALGNSSVADRANTVSVGHAGAERQIINLAKGTADTDAVNVSQLKGITTAMGGGAAVNSDGTIKQPAYDVNGTNYTNAGSAIDALDSRIDGVAANPLKFSGNSGTDVSRKLGETLKISGVGTTAGTFSGNNIKTVADAATGEIKIQMADAPKFGNVTVNDNGKISGLSDGTAATDAVTKGQMDTAVAGAGKWKLTANGATAKTITSSDTVNLVDGKNTKASFDSTTNQLKVDVVDAPTFSGMVTANGGLTVGAGKTVDMGGNKVTNVAAGSAATDAVNFGQLKASEQSVANALGGGSTVNTDGTITKPAYSVDGKTVNGVDGAITALDSGVKAAKDGINGLDGKITDLGDKGLTFSDTAGTKVQRKLGETLKISGVGTTAGTFSGNNIKTVADATTGEIKIQMADAPKFGNIVINDGGAINMGGGKVTNMGDATAAGDAVNKGQMDKAIADVSAGIPTSPMTFAGNTGSVTRKLGDTVGIKGGATPVAGTFSDHNVQTVADASGNITIKMAESPKFGGITVNDNGKISGLTDGTAATDAVTKGQMDTAVSGAGKWKLTANGAAAKTITSSDTVNLVDGKNTKASFDSTTNQLKVDVVDAPTFAGVVTAKGGIDMSNTKIANLANGTAAGDAVNFGQLKASEQSVANVLGGGSGVNADGTISKPAYSVDGKTVNGVDGAITALDSGVKAAKDGINGLDGKITDLGDKGLTFSDTAGTKVQRKLGETLKISGVGTTAGTFSGNNIKTVADATTGEIKIQMADAPQFGTIVINKGGNGTIDMGGGKVTNMGDATTAGDAVNKGQMDKAIADAAGGVVGSPLTFAGNDGTVARKLGETVTIKGDKKTAGTYSSDNIATVVGTDGTMKIQMADAPKFGNVVVNEDGSGRISGVTAGKDADDVATFGQVTDSAKSVADAIGGGAKVDPATGKVEQPTFTITDKDNKEHDSHTIADGFSTLDGRMDGIDGRVTIVEGNVTNIMNGAGIKYFHTNSTLADSQAKGVDSVAIGGNAIANAKNSVALGSNSTADRENTVSVGKAGAERQIVNVKAGVQQTDAVNVSQLKGIADAIGGGAAVDPTTGAITPPKFDVTDKDGNTVPATTVADAISTIDDHVVNVDNRVTNIEGDVTNILDGKAGLVQQDETTREITVGKDTDGTVVNFTNKDGEARVLDGVANGEIKEGGTQAINGGQAYDIANSVTEALGGGSVVNPDGTISKPQYDVTNADGTTEKVDGVEGAITNLDQRTYDNTTNITNLTQQINEGSVGLVQYDDATGTVTVAAGKGGTTVDFANVDGEARQLKNVAAGAEDTDAVNVKQLKDILGGTDTQDENGNYVGPTYNVTNVDGTTTEVHTVGDAITNLDGRVYNLYQNIEQGTVGLVQQAAAGEKLTVGKDTDGTEVNFAGTAGDRKLTGVENGEVSDKSHDAVNGSQLYSVASSITDALGGGSTVNEDGSVTTPVYNVTNSDGSTTTVNGVEGAITNLDQRTYSNTTQIENITNQISNGSVGLVQQAEKGADLTVGKGTDGKAVNFTGTEGDRVLTGVAAGSADNDAVNIKQLKDAGVINKDGSANAVVTYDNAEKTSITMGGEGTSTPVAIHNVADGVADHDAINVSQLNQRLQKNNTEVLNQANSYTDQRINDVWQDLGDEINQVNRQANRGIAAASALVNVTPYLPGKTAVNAGVASYRGEAALGVGVSRWSDNGRVNFNAGVSAAKGDQPVFRVGVGYVF